MSFVSNLKKSKKDEEKNIPNSFSSGTLYGIAEHGYEHAQEEERKGEYCLEEAIISIVFVSSFVEAFLNDLMKVPSENIPDNLRFLRLKWTKLERMPVKKKLWLIRQALGENPLKPEQQPYLDFKLLVDLRNALVHLKPSKERHIGGDEIEYELPEILRRLDAKGILVKREKNLYYGSWMLVLSTSAVAKWACETSVKIVKSIIDDMNESKFKNEMMNGLCGYLYKMK